MLSKELLLSRINEDYVQSFINNMPKGIEKLVAEKPAYMILGHGRSGKDTLAEYLRDEFDYAFDGTSSTILCNNIYPEDPETMYLRRHEFKDELFAFGNVIRDVDPRYIPFMTLKGGSDLLVGLRSQIDISASLDTCVKACIWIHSDVEDDPTMDYDLPWLLSACAKGIRSIGRTNYISKKPMSAMYEQIYGPGSYAVRNWVTCGPKYIQSEGHKTVPLYFINNYKGECGLGLDYFYSQVFALFDRLRDRDE